MNEQEKIKRARNMVLAFFNGNEIKMYNWFKAPIPLLGNTIPNDMIKNGRINKLLAFIEGHIWMNTHAGD